MNKDPENSKELRPASRAHPPSKKCAHESFRAHSKCWVSWVISSAAAPAIPALSPARATQFVCDLFGRLGLFRACTLHPRLDEGCNGAFGSEEFPPVAPPLTFCQPWTFTRLSARDSNNW